MSAELERANALMAQGRFADAAAAYDALLKRDPSLYAGWVNFAGALLTIGLFDPAIAACKRALALKPDDPAALNTYGTALNALGRPDEALAAFDTALAREPTRVNALVNRGTALLQLGRVDEAITSLDTALKVQPNNADAHYYRGLALSPLNRREETIASFDAALALRPGDPDYLYSKSIALLTFGAWRAAWPLFEERWRARRVRMSPPRTFDQPAWEGGKLDGVLRVWAEQGVGEEILLTRLLPMVLERTPRVMFDGTSRLAPLIQRWLPQIEVVREGAGPASAEAQVALGSLGAALNLGPEDVAARNDPLLRADPALQTATRARYEALAQGRRIVGIAWYSQNQEFGAHKSAALEHWRALLERDYFFVNLQYRSDPAEIAAAEHAFGCVIHTDPSVDQVADLEAFAAQIAALDTIVSVSNTTVHMAGALGVPCLTLLPPLRGLIWYWGAEGETTPSYKSVRLIRRAPGAPWEEQIARAAELIR